MRRFAHGGCGEPFYLRIRCPPRGLHRASPNVSAMRRLERFKGLVVVMLLLVFAKVGHQTYRWYAHDEERARIETLTGELEDVAIEVVSSQLVADSLRDAIQASDRGLEAARAAIAAYEAHAVGGALPVHLYDPYRRELEAHNRQVVSRNQSFERWRGVVDRNRAAVDRYNALADSIRMTAAEMGEAYYSIPTPAEVALERGIEPRR